MRYCTHCGKQLADNDLFCSRCKAYTSIKICRRCGNAVGFEDMFCRSCGANQSASVEDTFYPRPQYSPQPQIPQYPYQPVPFPPMQYPPVPYQQMPFPPAMRAPMQRKGLFKKGILPLYIWSLILVVLINPVGTTLSAVSTFYLLSANADEEDAETGIRKKKSLILNIAASAIDVLTFIILLVMAIAMK